MADEELMDDDQDEGGQFQAAAPSTGLNRIVKIMIYVALGAVGIVLMAVIAYYVARFAAASQYKEVASIAVVKPPPPLESFRFTDEFRVNTADQGESHFIKLRLSLGFEQGQAALSAELAQRNPQLRDIINDILASKKREELSTVKDMRWLREEIKAAINHILSEGKIKAVYFEEIIVN